MTLIEDATKTILDLEDERLTAMVAADVEMLDRILADDLSYVHTSAAIDTKESLTTGLASGRLNYESITPSDRVVRTHGSCEHAGHPHAWSTPFNEVGCPLRHGKHSKVEVRPDRVRHDRCVDDSQSVDAVDLAVLVHHGQRVI